MKKIFNFVMLFIKRINVIIIGLIITTSIYFSYFVISPKGDDLYEARFTWEIIRIPSILIYGSGQGELTYTDGEDLYLLRNILAINPEKIHRTINNKAKIFSKAKNYNCDITLEDWFRGKFEVRPSRELGSISIRFNEVKKPLIKNCKDFFYDIFLEENLKVISELMNSYNHRIILKNNHISLLEKRMININDNKDISKEIRTLTVHEFIRAIENTRTQLENLNYNIKNLEKIDKKLLLVDEQIKKSSNLKFFPGLIFSIALGLLFSVITIIILDFKKFRKFFL